MKPGKLFSLEDPLVYLPRRPVREIPRRRAIYNEQQPADGLYLVIRGRVKVTTAVDGGFETVSRIVCADGFFGESTLVGGRPESAVTLDQVNLMAWTSQEIETQVEREPRLGLALIQYLVRQGIELQDRIESRATYRTPERVMLSLIQLAATLGTPLPDGSTRIAALTHHTIADYVGTSREIVTCQMNRLRRLGLLRYSRKNIDVYVQALQNVLRVDGINLKPTIVSLEKPRLSGY